MDYSNKNLDVEIIKQINKEVALINHVYALNTPGLLRDEIFELLEKVGTLIFYPIEEENLWGIYFFRDDKNYFIINTRIELEKQVFAGAHELAHSLDIAKVTFETVTASLMTEYVNHIEYGENIKKADLIANRFAAELLVGSKKLLEKYNELNSTYNLAVKAVLLADIFLVPYKTIVKRFIETEMVTSQEDIDMLKNMSNEQVKEIAERYECCRRNYEISKETRLGGYINKALMLYENDLNTYDELKENLALFKKTPEEYDIYDNELDIYELIKNSLDNPDFQEDNDDEKE